MKPLYIVGTQRDVGKTTLSIGLVHALRQRGMKVAYTKPLGQRTSTVEGRMVHDDQRVVDSVLGLDYHAHVDMVIPIPSGRVEKEIYSFHPRELMAKVVAAFNEMSQGYDFVIVEAMGHVAMGSVMGMSAADVARNIGARALLVSGGGIGRAIDEISLCASFITSHGADLMGVVVNKVWQDKYDRVKEATSAGMKNLGITPLGTVPFEEQLASPTMRQVHERIGGELLGGQEHLESRARHTIVAAMLAEHMKNHIATDTMVITPGDRQDNILACLEARREPREGHSVSGLILTGGFRPGPAILQRIAASSLPVILVEQDTYAVASTLRQAIFKITPEDHERIEWAVRLVAQYVDIDGIVKSLE